MVDTRHLSPCYCCNRLMKISPNSDVSMNPNDDTGSRISNDRTCNYRHKYNSPLAIETTWKVLDNFKMEGGMWSAVYEPKYVEQFKWIIQYTVILIQLNGYDDSAILIASLSILILAIDMKLWYNNSSMSKINLGVEPQCYCCNRLMKISPNSDVSMNPNDDTGSRISNDRTCNYRHKHNSPPLLYHYEIA